MRSALYTQVSCTICLVAGYFILFLPVDDGTSVIDCFHRQSTQSKLPKAPSTKVQSIALWEPQDTPKPIASLGSLVSVIGRVLQWHESRQIGVDCIGR
jgi:hypothetical protein